MLWDSWRLWFSRRPRENNPAALVCSSSPPSHRSPPPSHRSPPPVYDSSRPRRRVLFLLPPTRSLPFCRRRPLELSPRRPCSYPSRPRTVCLPPSAAPCRRSDEATFHRSLSPEASSAPTPPSCLALPVSSCARRLSTNRQRVNAMCDSLVMPFLLSLNDIDNRDQYRIYTRNGYEESTTAV